MSSSIEIYQQHLDLYCGTSACIAACNGPAYSRKCIFTLVNLLYRLLQNRKYKICLFCHRERFEKNGTLNSNLL
jgi:hypothetical protein